MPEGTENMVTGPETAKNVQQLLDELGERADACLRIKPQWFLEIEMPVNKDGDPVEGSVEDADTTSWMICTGVKADRKEIEKIKAFREEKNPEDNLRIVCEYLIHVVEDGEK